MMMVAEVEVEVMEGSVVRNISSRLAERFCSLFRFYWRTTGGDPEHVCINDDVGYADINTLTHKHSYIGIYM